MPTLTFTAGAMSKVARNMPSGTIARAAYFDVSLTGQTVGANLTRVQFCKIPNLASISYLAEEHSSTFTDGEFSFGAVISLKMLTSDSFAARPLITNGVDHGVHMAPPSLLRENGTVLIPDTQATQYGYLQGGYTISHSHSVGAAINLKGWLNVIYTMDGF